MNNTELEEALLIFSWGRWAQDRIDKMMGVKPQHWATLVKTSSAYDVEPKNPIPRISDDYGERIDRLVCSLGDPSKWVLVDLYCNNHTVASLSRASGKSKHEIRNIRDSALNQMYGALKLADAV